MTEHDESDQLPEEGPSRQVPDDDEEGGGSSRGSADKSAGVPDDEGQGGEGQASGNPDAAG